MGDVLHTLPALTDAINAYPDIRFDWAVEEGFAQIPSWHQAVDTVIPVAIRRWRKSWFSAPIRAERAQFRQAIQAHHYDVVIDAQGLLKSAFLVTRYAKGTKHGYSRQSAREPLASFFYDIRHDVSKKMHAIERIRQLFALSLNYPIPQSQGDYGIAQHFLSLPAVDERPYLVFLHATTRDEKHWPESHWRELIALLTDSGLRIKLPWGAEHEHQRAIRLAKDFDYVDVLPKMSLADVAQVIAGAKSVVSVDTGLSHLTAALDKPNITLFGPTDPGLIGGYGKDQTSVKAEGGDIGEISAQDIFIKLNNNE